MGVLRTRTIKNKHAANGSGIRASKAAKNPQKDVVLKSKKKGSAAPPPKLPKGKAAALFYKKKRVYTEKELGIPELNMVTPVGVEKPRGKKKGKVFVDDPESMNTILAIVQADKQGQIESKMIKARQMEEIREARRVEAEKKEGEKKSKLDDLKEGLKKKRKRNSKLDQDVDMELKDASSAGTKAVKPKKRVSFA